MKITRTGQIANKQSMNLAIIEKKQINPIRVLLTTLVAILILGVVGKFGVLDRYDKVAQACSAMQDQQDLYNALLIANAAYDDVVLEYNKYSFGAMTEEERAVADRGQVLNLIEEYLVTEAMIENVDLNGNELNVEMSGINLEQASSLINVLLTDALVDSVNVASANSEESDTVISAGETTESEAASTDEENRAESARDAKIMITIKLADNTVGAVAESAVAGEENSDYE